MADECTPLEDRFEQLTREVRALSARVDDLALRLTGDHGESAARDVPQPVAIDEFDAGARGPEISGAAVLAGLAEICFVLVIALTLRTLVDNRIIDQPIGAAAGLAYAALVMVYGYYRARSGRRYATLTVVCGMTLVVAVSLETHFRFGLLPSSAVYGILAAALAMALGGGLASGAYAPLNAAVPGMTVAAMTLDFPDPDFAYLGGVVLVAALASFAVTQHPRTRWLVWCTFALSAYFWMWWTLKLRIPLARGDELAATVRQAWFLPCLGAYAALCLAQTLYAALRAGRPVGAFECAAPGIAVAGAYAAARAAVTASDGVSTLALGWAGFAAAMAFAVLAVALAGRGDAPRRAATWLGAGALLVLAVCAPDACGNPYAALAVWTSAAVAAGLYGAARLDAPIAYAAILLHAVACGAGAWWGAYRVQPASPAVAIAALLAVACVCVFHHDRMHREAHGAADTANVARRAEGVLAVVVFWVGVVYAFGAGRIAFYEVLARGGGGALYAFECGQSILINVGALGLAVFALNRRRPDLLATAAVMAGVGALKVFTFDLLRTQGVPLVLDVLAFGLTATAGSLIWGRWQRNTAPGEGGI